MFWAVVTLIILVAAVATIVVTAVVLISEWVKGKGKGTERLAEFDTVCRCFRESEQFNRVPENAITVMCLDGSAYRGLVSGVNHNCWRTDNLLHFFPQHPLVTNYLAYQKCAVFGSVIPVSSIQCFKKDGILTYEHTRTTPAVDHSIAGSAVIAHDTRHTQLIVKDPGGNESVILFSEVAYYAFQHIIPEKEHKIAVEASKKPSIEELLASMEQTAVYDDTALRRDGKLRRRRTEQADQPAI